VAARCCGTCSTAATKWFEPEEISERALPLLEQMQLGSLAFVAPESFVAEFGHSMRRHVLGQPRPALNTSRASRTAELTATVPPELAPHTPK